MNFQKLLENKRYTEVLYFGSVELSQQPTAKLHLWLALACSGAIAPIANVQRLMNNIDGAHTRGELLVGRDTLLVYEAVRHFTTAIQLEPSIIFPSLLHNVATEIMTDLHHYSTQEFHGFRSPDKSYSLRTYAIAAMCCITKLTENIVRLPVDLHQFQIKSAQKLLNELGMSEED